MSWDASLKCDACGHWQSWNYTGNITAMVETALKDDGVEYDAPNFHAHLNGMTAEQGAEWLTTVIGALRKSPGKYRKMDPPNGWGDYDGILARLVEMRDAAEASAVGYWSAD